VTLVAVNGAEQNIAAYILDLVQAKKLLK